MSESLSGSQSYGAVSEIATACFVELAVCFREVGDPDLRQWFTQMLKEPSQDPDRTIAHLYDVASQRRVVSGVLRGAVEPI